MTRWLSYLFLVYCAASTLASIETQLIVAQVKSNPGEIKLSSKQQNYCYDFPLTLTHPTEPHVAVSLASFSIAARQESYLSIRVRTAEITTSTVPVILRVPNAVAGWKSIGFYILASSRQDIQLSIFRLETTSLTSCTNAASQSFSFEVNANYPEKNYNAVKAFICGWEINTKSNDKDSNTTFQAAITDAYIENQVISLTVTRISKTELSSLYVSYFIINQNSALKYTTGYYNILPASASSATLAGPDAVTDFKFFGIGGFIFKTTDQSIDINVAIVNPGTLTFDSKSLNQLIVVSVQYVLLKGSEVQNQKTLIIPNNQNNQILNPLPAPVQNTVPPTNVFPINNVVPPTAPPNVPQPLFNLFPSPQPAPSVMPSPAPLILPPAPQPTPPPPPAPASPPAAALISQQNPNCPRGCRSCRTPSACSVCIDAWILHTLGSMCLPLNGNLLRGKLICNYGYKEFNDACVLNCSQNQVAVNGSCVPAGILPRSNTYCPPETSYIKNGACVRIPEGGIWNGNYLSCKDGYYMINDNCLPVREGQYLFKGIPVCKIGYYNKSGTCTKLNQNEVFVNGSVRCNNASYLLNGRCESLPPNSFWNGSAINCLFGYYRRDDGSCLVIPPNAIWNGTILFCRDGFFNVSGACLSSPANAQWNGTTFACKKDYVNISGVCSIIPPNAEWNGTALNCKTGYFNASGNCVYIPSYAYWNGVDVVCLDGYYKSDRNCLPIPQNTELKNGKLSCKVGFYNVSGNCVAPPINTEWNGFAFVCQQGYYFNAFNICIALPSNSEFVNNTLRCKSGFKNISGACQPVTGKINISFTGKAYFENRVILNVRIDGIPPNIPEEVLLSQGFLSVKTLPEAGFKAYPGYVFNSRNKFNIIIVTDLEPSPSFWTIITLSDTIKNSSAFSTIDTDDSKRLLVDSATLARVDNAQNAK